MNPTTLQPVIHQAQRRLAQVAQLADEANIALPDHHLDTVREKLAAILRLTNFAECDILESV
jgi:hypothetical protein